MSDERPGGRMTLPMPDNTAPNPELDRLEQRINRLERAVLELAARPLPGYDFHHPPWPPEGELGDIHKLHHAALASLDEQEAE